MILLVHAAPVTLAPHRRPQLGVLSSPRRWYSDVDGWPWAADNDAFSKWDADRYRAMLVGLRGLSSRPLFVTAPDVVGDSAETLRRFREWRGELEGLPVALVGQDGMQVDDVPWPEVAALFLGGTTEWKMGDDAAALAREAKARGLWLHMGRVNSHRRLLYAKALGCDSADGTQLSWFRDRWLDEFLRHAAEPPQLLLGNA